VLKCKHYGRYVDDFYIVSSDKEYLHSIIPKIEEFLKSKMHLEINKGKTRITSYNHGVEFLGTFIKPYRNYVSNQCLKRMKKKLILNDGNGWHKGKNIEYSVNSYIGVFIHNSSYNIRKELFSSMKRINTCGIFNRRYSKYYKVIGYP